jgi:hypothetical protein
LDYLIGDGILARRGVWVIKTKGGEDLIAAGRSTLTSVLLEHCLADDLVLLESQPPKPPYRKGGP